MRYSDILLHLSDDQRSAEKTGFALALAKRFKASVTALYTMPFPAQLYYMGEYVPAEFYQQQSDEAEAAAARTKAAFEKAAVEADVAATWVKSDQVPALALLPLGRTSDIVIVGQKNPDAPILTSPDADFALSDLLLDLGRPVLAIPYIGQYAAPGKTAVVAWNGSREAARAVHDALPLLQDARSVIVFSINPDAEVSASAASLVQHLIHYGIPARAKQTVAKDIDEGEALLSALADAGADLLVMGVYGHSRVREMVLGGVSQSILSSMTVPVLLSN